MNPSLHAPQLAVPHNIRFQNRIPAEAVTAHVGTTTDLENCEVATETFWADGCDDGPLVAVARGGHEILLTSAAALTLAGQLVSAADQAERLAALAFAGGVAL